MGVLECIGLHRRGRLKSFADLLLPSFARESVIRNCEESHKYLRRPARRLLSQHGYELLKRGRAGRHNPAQKFFHVELNYLKLLTKLPTLKYVEEFSKQTTIGVSATARRGKICQSCDRSQRTKLKIEK